MSLRLRELKASMEIEGEIAERSAHEAVEWQKILKLPIKLADGRVVFIRDVEANFRVCQGRCDPLDVTAEGVKLLLDDSTPESLVNRISLADAETIKRELIDKICDYLDGMTQAPGAVEQRRKLMAFWSLENLRAELVRIESVSNLREKPASELRQIVKQGRSASGRPDSPLPLPLKILIHGEMVKLTSGVIKGLDSDSLRTLIRKYGADAVSQRLRGE